MGLIEHSGPTCNRCGVLYIAEYTGPCQEPKCSGRVTWEATADRLASQLAGAVEALQAIAVEHVRLAGDDVPQPTWAARQAQDALDALGGQ